MTDDKIIKELKERLNEEIDDKLSYYHDLQEAQERIAELEDWNKWYEMWHTKFKKQIEELTTELETYRPTKLTGEGQTTCHCCKERNWTCFGFYHYKGQTLCDECLKKVLKEENKGNQQIHHEICEKIRNFFDVNPDVVDWDYLNEILNKIEGGE